MERATDVSTLFCVVHRVHTRLQEGTDMGTLTNVTFPGEEAASPRVGVTTDSIPEARSQRTGESVEYVPSPDKQWYVLRTSYGREDLAADHFIHCGDFVYIARRRTIRRDAEGKKHKVLEVLTPNLVFAYLTEAKAEEYVHGTPSLPFVSYYYNHFETGLDFKNPPLTVPSRQMVNFIRATCSQSEHLRHVSLSDCHFRNGSFVRVTCGEYKGVEGRVARIGGQQRVVVSLPNGVIHIATAYIPSAFLEVVSNQ